MEGLKEQLVILIGTPFYFTIMGIELLISNYQHRNWYNWRDTAANVYLMLFNSLIELVIRMFYLGIFVYLLDIHLIQFTNPVVYWVMLFVLIDFLYYWLHRFDHEIRLFWAVHVTHHSSSFMNFTVGFRSSVFQPLYRFFYFLPLPLLGFEPLDILFVFAATQMWGIFVHTEMVRKMGWLEHVLVTPSHHRVHHASNPKYLDKNMGMFLIIWDKLFGTFQAELPDSEYEPIKYGLTRPLVKEDPGTLIFHEWSDIRRDVTRNDIGWKERWWYLFGPPGWSHDGSRKTSEQMRAQENGKSLTPSHLTEELVEVPTLVNIDGHHNQRKNTPNENRK